MELSITYDSGKF